MQMQMQMNRNPIPKSSPGSTAAVGGECGNCDAKDIWVVHHVRLRGIYRRLCTSCVLRLHPASFCPSCFTFYDSTPPPPSKRLSCANCSSFTHSHCAPPHPPSPFLCPPCSRPNDLFSFFHPLNNNTDTTTSAARGIIDKKMAAVLLCAASIASASMAKAVIVARAEAERRVREAALCRKRAREALEHVSFLVNKDKLLKKDAVVDSIEVVSGSGNNSIKVVVDAVPVGSPNTPNNNNNHHHHHHPQPHQHQHQHHRDHGNGNGNENDKDNASASHCNSGLDDGKPNNDNDNVKQESGSPPDSSSIPNLPT